MSAAHPLTEVETNEDVVLSEPDGRYLATLCGACSGYRRDATNGPNRRLFRYVTKFCTCALASGTPTLVLAAGEIEKLLAAIANIA